MIALPFLIQLHIFLIYLLKDIQHLIIPDKCLDFSLVQTNTAFLVLADPHPLFFSIQKQSKTPKRTSCSHHPPFLVQTQRMVRANVYKKIEIQRLLDEHNKLQGELTEIEGKIEERELEYFSNSTIDAPSEPFPMPKRLISISPKDKKFSLSSIFSRASLDLINIEVKRSITSEKSKQQKKKKGKKSKGKPSKSKKINRRKR